MNFADQLRQTTDQVRNEKHDPIAKVAQPYISVLQDACYDASYRGKREVSFYLIKGYEKTEYVTSLPLYEGDAHEREQARKEARIKDFTKYPGPDDNRTETKTLGYEIDTAYKAQVIADRINQAMEKLGLNGQTSVCQFHKIQEKRRVNIFTGTITITYHELPQTFYYLKIHAEW